MNENLPTVTLSEAKSIIKALAQEQSVLLLSPPGVGKSESVMQAAADAGLECRSLLGTQIAPEDVSGIPRIVGERSVFCPPRVLLPENPKPFCLFLDELPACTPDIQKSFYSLLLERRLGEHELPPGTWVVAAGNRAEDRSLVRSLSAALVNRVIILKVRVDVKEWLQWGHSAGVRPEILAFITFNADSLMRTIPSTPAPFSTPRAWVSLSRSLDLLEASKTLTPETMRAIAYGRVSPEDASMFTVFVESNLDSLKLPIEYMTHKVPLPEDRTQRWFILHGIRQLVLTQLDFLKKNTTPEQILTFLQSIKREELASLLLGLVEEWGQLGASPAICMMLEEITGIKI
ncbi:MAG: AAA family ATPase [Thermoguttaceae bacterium]|nr:AAA family ATPase [Thermoguttaceae bacterium]